MIKQLVEELNNYEENIEELNKYRQIGSITDIQKCFEELNNQLYVVNKYRTLYGDDIYTNILKEIYER